MGEGEVNPPVPKPERRITERLILDVPAHEDIPDLFQFMGNREAMRLTHHCESLDDCSNHVFTHEAKREVNGCAPWVVRELASNIIVGWGGLYDDPFDPGWGVELAYYFSPRAWGKGYATELALAALVVARDELHLPLLRAFSHPENLASHSVLRKAGLQKQRFVKDMNRYLFEIRFSA